MKIIKWPLLAFLLILGACNTKEFYVAPDGSDSNPGTAAQPFATMQQARDAVREARGTNTKREYTVVIAPGIYQIDATLELDERDSNITFKGKEAQYTGGIFIEQDQMHLVTDQETLSRLPTGRDPGIQLYEIRLSDIGQMEFPVLNSRGMAGVGRQAAWPELFLDGKPLPIASWPNGIGYKGGFKPSEIIDAGLNIRNDPQNNSDNTLKGQAWMEYAQSRKIVFRFDDPHTDRWQKALHTHHADLWFGGHWRWDWVDDLIQVDAISDREITMRRSHHYGMRMDYTNLKIFNLVEEMDIQGEYVLEPANHRLLVLLSDEQASQPLTLSWFGESAVHISGTNNIRFTGISFTDLRSTEVVKIENASHVEFSNCRFERNGGDGLLADGMHLVVEDCLFSYMGAGGVIMTGGDRNTLTPGHNRVSYCEFAHFGRLKRTYAHGVQVTGVGNVVEHCLLHGAPHAAINFGGNEHHIRYNEIHTVLTETGDCGAIYGGRDWTSFGTEIYGNWIHGLGGSADRWANAVYLDDCLSGITVRDNFIDEVALGMLIGGGRYNEITNNILSNCIHAMHLDSRGTGWMKPPHEGFRTLERRLKALPVDQEPWLSRYPMLKETPDNDPGKPVGTAITNNAFVNCKKSWLTLETSDVATVSPNWEDFAPGTLTIDNNLVRVAGTSLKFTIPNTGIRK